MRSAGRTQTYRVDSARWPQGGFRWGSGRPWTKNPEVLRLVMGMVKAGTAFCVPGNHDVKLMRKLRGKDVKITHGLADSLAQLEPEPPEFKRQVADFIDDLVSHYVFDDGRLVVAHAGMKEEMQGRGSGAVRSFALYRRDDRRDRRLRLAGPLQLGR